MTKRDPQWVEQLAQELATILKSKLLASQLRELQAAAEVQVAEVQVSDLQVADLQAAADSQVEADLHAFAELQASELLDIWASFSHSDIYLIMRSAPEIVEQADKLLKKETEWGKRVSNTDLCDRLARLFAQLVTSKDVTLPALKSAVEKLADQLSNYSEIATVYIPIVGVAMSVKSISFGRVTLLVMDEVEYQLVQTGFETALANASHLTAEERQERLEWRMRDIKEDLQGHVCAKIPIAADWEMAIIQAEVACREMLDLLRYAIPFIYGPQGTVRTIVDMQGGSGQEKLSTVRIVIGPSGDIGSSFEVTRMLQKFDLSPESLQQMIPIGFFHLIAIFGKPDRTEFENTLLEAIHWFANSQTELDIQYQFLSLMICLETLFTRGQQEPISRTLGEGVVILVGDSIAEREKLYKQLPNEQGVALPLKDTITEREKLYNQMTGFYNQRSSIAHGKGRGKDILLEDVTKLLEITQVVLVHLIHRHSEFTTRKALGVWIDRRKFSYVSLPSVDEQSHEALDAQALYARYINL